MSFKLRACQPANIRSEFACGLVCLQLMNKEWIVDRVQGATD